MLERHTYKGIVDGVFGIFVDKKPENIELQEEVVWYSADEGKVFVDKEGNMLDSVVITEGVDIKDFVEIVKPKEETNEQTEM